MIVEFKAENFRSFRDCVTLSMVSSADKSMPENIIRSDETGRNFLKSAVIFGANASGKSNVVIAIALLRNLVLQSHAHQKGLKLNFQPFRFDTKCEKKPTIFSITFIHEGVRLQYRGDPISLPGWSESPDLRKTWTGIQFYQRPD
jgi:hypothetical protein